MSEFKDDKKGAGEETSLARLVDLINEAGMLRQTPRSGYQFLGSGKENVAEHSFRVALISYFLAEASGADSSKCLLLSLIHDFHEARTGDFNYVNYLYNKSNARQAMKDALAGTGFEERLMSAWEEQDEEKSPEAIIVSDADQLDLIFNLVHEKKMGNPYAEKWLASALGRLQTEKARALAEKALATDPAGWWFKDPDNAWWINRVKD